MYALIEAYAYHQARADHAIAVGRNPPTNLLSPAAAHTLSLSLSLFLSIPPALLSLIYLSPACHET